jgi:hypothetical protein
MDRERVDAWLDGYRRAWEQADTPAVLGLFTADATYRSHPLRLAHAGHRGVADYWARVTADQRDVRVRFGDPIVDGDRVAVEWWTVMRAGGDPVTLAGCLLLTFAADGRCQALRECWNLAEALVDPPPDWGHLDLDAGGRDQADTGTGPDGAGRARPPLGRGLRGGLAGRRPRGGGRPVRPGRPLPLKALPRPTPGSRGRPGLHPGGLRHRGRPGSTLRHPVRRWRLGRGRVLVRHPGGGPAGHPRRHLVPQLQPRGPGRHRPRLLVPGGRLPPPTQGMGSLTSARTRHAATCGPRIERASPAAPARASSIGSISRPG